MAVLKNTLTLNDALKISSPLRFNMMFKPIGSVCNLDCSYCYYLDKKKMFADNSMMPISLLEKIIKEYVLINNNEQIVFDWHGGEPLLLGLDYFKKIVARMRLCFSQRESIPMHAAAAPTHDTRSDGHGTDVPVSRRPHRKECL